MNLAPNTFVAQVGLKILKVVAPIVIPGYLLQTILVLRQDYESISFLEEIYKYFLAAVISACPCRLLHYAAHL
jgi:hypothetical protein